MTRAPIPAAARTVHLRENGQYLTITPPVRELAEVFFTARHQPIDLGAEGIWTTPCAEPLVWDTTVNVETADPDAAGQATLVCDVPAQQCFRGLAPLVEAELKRRGHRVKWTRKPLATLPEPTTADLVAGGVDHSLPEFVRGHERGIVRYGRGVQVERLVVQVAAAWPTKRIVVVATRKRDVRAVYRTLAGTMPHVGCLMPGAADPIGTRVVVATPAALGRGPAAIEHRQLYLALDPDELFSAGQHQYAMQGVRHLRRARLFGFLPVWKTLPPLRRDLIRALFGADEHVIPSHGCTRRTVRVVFEKNFGGPRVDADGGVFPIVRDAIHTGGLRNRLVCRLTRALIARNKAKLTTEYPTIASLVAGGPRRIVVYVDNADHGLKLAHRLQLPLVVDVLADRDSLTSEDLRILDLGAVSWGDSRQPVVVTTEGLRHLGRFDVLVRADGGTGRLPLPARHLKNRSGDDRDLVVIDFKDAAVPLLRQRARLRAEAYREAGWEIAGEPSPAPLELFKATRPEVFR